MRCVLLVVTLVAAPAAASAQAVSGTLLDAQSDLPVPLGLVMMFTEAGDSITATVADEQGRFRIASSTPGSFVLLANALGYRETGAGVFELGVGGEIQVEYRLPPAPLPIDAVVVALDRPTVLHHLVRNGFVRRYQRGLGLFVTPHQIEESPARSTEQLLAGLPGVRVGPVYQGVGSLGVPSPEVGEVVQIQTPAGWCAPAIYVDGVRTHYDPNGGFTLTGVVDIGSIEAIEVYRRPAEIPLEYGSITTHCGVLVAWSKSGLAPGQRPSGSSRTAGFPRSEDGVARLPAVDRTGSPPEPGEQIRVALSPGAAERLDVDGVFEGRFVQADEGEIVATDPRTARALALPVGDVLALQVERPRPDSYAVWRGVRWGAAAGLFTVGGLTFLCSWSACNGSAVNLWLPSLTVGGLVGLAVKQSGPGRSWVSSAVPGVERSPAGGLGVGWAVRVR